MLSESVGQVSDRGEDGGKGEVLDYDTTVKHFRYIGLIEDDALEKSLLALHTEIKKPPDSRKSEDLQKEIMFAKILYTQKFNYTSN
jgi:hypothetical protein